MPSRLIWIVLAIALDAAALSAARGQHSAPSTSSSTSASAATVDQTIDHVEFDQILRRHVRGERVDYLTLRKTDWPALCAYLERIENAPLEKLPRSEQLAAYINLYNASMIRAVIERFREDYSPQRDDFAVFKAPLVRLAQRSLSLDELEHQLIRKRFREPRIHVALVCAAVSCPPLLPRAYRAADLEALLEENMRRFVRDAARNTLDASGRRVALSQIFEWYSDDFGGKPALLEYCSRFSAAPLRGYSLTFRPYDWSLNAVSPSGGRWVTISADSAALTAEPGAGPAVANAERGEVFEVLEARGAALLLDRPLSGSQAWVEGRLTRPLALR